MKKQGSSKQSALPVITFDERNLLARGGAMTYDQAGAFLTVDRTTIRHLIEAGKLIGADITEKRRGVAKISVEAYLASRFIVPDKNEVPERLMGEDRVAYIQAECTKRLIANVATLDS